MGRDAALLVASVWEHTHPGSEDMRVEPPGPLYEVGMMRLTVVGDAEASVRGTALIEGDRLDKAGERQDVELPLLRVVVHIGFRNSPAPRNRTMLSQRHQRDSIVCVPVVVRFLHYTPLGVLQARRLNLCRRNQCAVLQVC